MAKVYINIKFGCELENKATLGLFKGGKCSKKGL